MKKLITISMSFLLAFVIFAFDSPKVEAASSPVSLTTGQYSATTSRIPVNGKLGFSINNLGTKTVHFNLFKNGVLVSSGMDVAPGKIISNTNHNWSKGDYSMRVYCGPRFSSQLGCRAQGSIGN